jgi:uncharacterized membrane protein
VVDAIVAVWVGIGLVLAAVASWRIGRTPGRNREPRPLSNAQALMLIGMLLLVASFSVASAIHAFATNGWREAAPSLLSVAAALAGVAHTAVRRRRQTQPA